VPTAFLSRLAATTLLDLRYAVRMLRKSPAYTAITAATLALVIGANTAIFSIVDNLFFRPPPFKDVDRLVQIVATNPDNVTAGAEPGGSPGNVIDWHARMRSLDASVCRSRGSRTFCSRIRGGTGARSRSRKASSRRRRPTAARCSPAIRT